VNTTPRFLQGVYASGTVVVDLGLVEV